VDTYTVEIHDGRRTVAVGNIGIRDIRDPRDVEYAADTVAMSAGWKRGAERGWRIKVYSTRGWRKLITETRRS
jgi:hypothetical protein